MNQEKEERLRGIEQKTKKNGVGDGMEAGKQSRIKERRGNEGRI